ncbi:MAG TPA: Coenzyme F420 hydrogenase/dehydrogenase, beta subunit C-terminal domain [Thermodesulfobacteriota bacterium]|nr:Coenzyme F420 hydrogenase/dehydrogenase, beta subunit C-terminal domain [Thermodesulfobacteriota bacterium]
MGSEVKTFHDLEKEVQRYNFCGKCGGCVAFCSADNLGALKVGPGGMPVFADEEKCLKCGICYMICPNIRDLDEELKKKTNWEPPLGPIKDLVSAQTTNPVVSERCTDGGVVTSLLLYLLENHMIDGALVSKSDGPFHRGPVLATSGEEVVSASGSHFDESFSISELGSQYSTYSPAIQELKSLRKGSIDRVAMVGTPCQIHTVRKMQVLGIIPSDVIKYCFGLFCMENFSFNDIQLRHLEKQYGFDLAHVSKVNVKEDFFIYLNNGRVIHIPFEEIDSIARPACLVCPDFSAEFSDISFGGLGSREGYTTVLLRSERGKMVYRGALTAGYIKERRYSSSEKARADLIKVQRMVLDFSQRKKERALKNRGAMAGFGTVSLTTP